MKFATVLATVAVVTLVSSVVVVGQDQDIATILESSDVYKRVRKALKNAKLLNALSGEGPFTLFAPTNSAFARAGPLLESLTEEETEALLLYHVVPSKLNFSDPEAFLVSTEYTTLEGMAMDVNVRRSFTGDLRAVFVNEEAKVKVLDIPASNGMIQVISSVLVPQAAAPSFSDVVSLAIEEPSLSTFVSSVSGVGLADVLQGPGPFTIFAPTQNAFRKLGNKLDFLLLPDSEGLFRAILKYHVLAGMFMSGDLADGWYDTDLETTQVQIDFRPRSGLIRVNNSTRVKTSDLVAGNGVIHTINNVLLPPRVDFFGKNGTLKPNLNLTFPF